jgi:hypothetical protein
LEPASRDSFEAWLVGRLAMLYLTGFWKLRADALVSRDKPALVALIQLGDHLSDKEHWWWAKKTPMPELDVSKRTQLQLICCGRALWSEIDWVNLNDVSHCLALSHLPAVIAGFTGKKYSCGVESPGAIPQAVLKGVTRQQILPPP